MADLDNNNQAYTELLTKIYNINLEMNQRISTTESMLKQFSERANDRIAFLERDIQALEKKLKNTEKMFNDKLENGKMISKFKKNASWIIPVSMLIIAFCLLYREHLISLEPGKNHSFVYTFFRDYVR